VTDPYRVKEDDAMSRTNKTAAFEQTEARFEQRALAIVLVVAGIVGVLIGLSTPRSSGGELTFGTLFVALGLWTWISDGSSRSAMKGQQHEQPPHATRRRTERER
jgi:hypothetical protein